MLASALALGALCAYQAADGAAAFADAETEANAEGGAVADDREAVRADAADLELTEAERSLAAQTPTLRVGVFVGREPMSYVDATGRLAGVTCDVLDRIAQETGLSFEYVALDGSDALERQVDELSLDIVAGCERIIGSEGGYGYAMSAPYSSTRAVVAFNEAHSYSDLSTDMVMATTYDRAREYESLGYNVLSCATVADCLAAVDQDRAAYTYENSHVIPVVLGEGSYDNVLTVDASFQDVSLCLALVPAHDTALLGILDKAILSIPARDVIAMVYDHTYANRTITIRELIAQHPATFALIVSVPLLVVVVALAVVAFTRSRAASRDPLTQAFNATTFRRKVQARLRARSGSNVRCLLIIDIDDFKHVNDRYGHYEGDNALKACAAALKASCGKGEYSARMGGDEFLAYWEGRSPEEIVGRAEALNAAMTAEVAAQKTIGDEVTASIGIARFRVDQSYDDLYRRADEALYRGKGSGKGCVSFDA